MMDWRSGCFFYQISHQSLVWSQHGDRYRKRKPTATTRPMVTSKEGPEDYKTKKQEKDFTSAVMGRT
jgi:hypothetical protein